MIKKGIVLKVTGKTAYLLTSTAQFTCVKISGSTPAIGEEYEGPLKKEHNIITNLLYLIIAVVILCTSYGYYIYTIPKTTIMYGTTPSLMIKTNKFSRVLDITILNDTGKILLNNIKVKNLNINDALTSIMQKDITLKQSKDTKAAKVAFESVVYITGSEVTLDRFINFINTSKVNFKIVSNGKIINFNLK